MSRLVSRAEGWERVYTSFQNINFAAFDYDSVKHSIIDYIKLYFPESYNDWIESDELVAIIETFAYIAELVSYRIDMAAHENFISSAQRKDSILKLAKLVSYHVDRPLPARGLVKITSVSTTESLFDVYGNSLTNKAIIWNDLTNANWKEQFILVMNKILSQPFGTINPTDRFQQQDVLFELYNLNSTPLKNGVFPYSTKSNGKTLPMELVPVEYDNDLGIIERRPSKNANFSFLYGQDGMGDASDTTGFFCFTKQGSLQKLQKTFDGVTKNITYDINVDNINNLDVWINNIDPATGETIESPSFVPYRQDVTQGKIGEWVQVDTARSQNVIFNTNPHRNKYEIETRDNNRIRLIFGDGEFADIPSGTFDIWYRTSINEDILISQSSIVNQSMTFSYVDVYNKTQTCTFTFSLINSLQNNSAAETLEHIRLSAPAVYYAQDRMVNGNDYNTFMLQDSSILKLRTFNRTFAGESLYASWHDPSSSYENVKIFGDDGAIYYQDNVEVVNIPTVSINNLLSYYINPLLSSSEIFLKITSYGVSSTNYRRLLNNNELNRLTIALTPPPSPADITLYYNKVNFEWYAVPTNQVEPIRNDAYFLTNLPNWPSNYIEDPIMSIKQLGDMSDVGAKYTISKHVYRLILHSPTTKFWNINQNKIIDYSTFNSDYDTISILQANSNYNRTSLLNETWNFRVVSQVLYDTGTQLGLQDITKISILPVDNNGDGIPDYLNINDMTGTTGLLTSTEDLTGGLANILNPKIKLKLSDIFPTTSVLKYELKLPFPILKGYGDVKIYLSDMITTLTPGSGWSEGPNIGDAEITDTIVLYNSLVNLETLYVVVNDNVYFYRPDRLSEWEMKTTNIETLSQYYWWNFNPPSPDDTTAPGWIRRFGRQGLNFAWFHKTPNYYLIDPAPTNIMDTYIIQKGYFAEFKRWMEDPYANKPIDPTPLDMRMSYNYLLDNRMLSDTIVLHPGKFKILFGSKADILLQAVFKVIRAPNANLTNNQIKNTIVTTIRNFFNPTLWEFGETFYFSEMAAAIHAALPNDISSIVLVPTYPDNYFGDLYTVYSREDEIFYPDITVNDIDIVSEYNEIILKAVRETVSNCNNNVVDDKCAYIDQYCELTYTTGDYIESLNCKPIDDV